MILLDNERRLLRVASETAVTVDCRPEVSRPLDEAPSFFLPARSLTFVNDTRSWIDFRFVLPRWIVFGLPRGGAILFMGWLP